MLAVCWNQLFYMYIIEHLYFHKHFIENIFSFLIKIAEVKNVHFIGVLLLGLKGRIEFRAYF